MSDEDVAQQRQWYDQGGSKYGKALGRDVIFAVGNAPTALVRLYELIKRGRSGGTDHCGTGRICECSSVERTDPEPERDSVDRCTGRKGGSNIAACICNALLYQM